MTFFSDIKKWYIPESAMIQSLKEMSFDGLSGNEGITLWLGQRNNGLSEVTHLVALRGSGIIKQPDLLIIKSDLLNDVTDLAAELNVSLIGQIHSHGKNYGTGLSITDRRFGILVPYYLSIVAPDYAMRTNTSIYDCGVHIYEPDFGYRRLSHDEITNKIHLKASSELPFFVVGGE